MADDDLAIALGVNRIREQAAEDASWVLAFHQPLVAAGLDEEHAFLLTQQWLEAQMAPQIIEVSAGGEYDALEDCDVPDA